MNTQHQTLQAILDKIKSYNRIIITRHRRPDGDAIGSSRGLAGILRATFPEKEIYTQTEDSSNYLAFLGADNDPIADELYADALVIVTDTANLQRISNSKDTGSFATIRYESTKNEQYKPQKQSAVDAKQKIPVSCLHCYIPLYTYWVANNTNI